MRIILDFCLFAIVLLVIRGQARKTICQLSAMESRIMASQQETKEQLLAQLAELNQTTNDMSVQQDEDTAAAAEIQTDLNEVLALLQQGGGGGENVDFTEVVDKLTAANAAMANLRSRGADRSAQLKAIAATYPA